MKHSLALRSALRAATLLLAATLAACSEAPTGASISAADQPAALNTAPTVTVTNSGGSPLLSWSALSGATGYSVVLVETETQTNRQTAESTSTSWEYPLGSTTGTSLLDSGHPYTGDWLCSYTAYPIVTRVTYRYRVTATYADGSAASSVFAPVAPC
ncbi:hypothetical protein [Longimicrobium sp.]|uniref:hypothetical protein n=1 Tax=Longimicrobium sp. TaxID=2029185 RepID=UPI002E2F930A|nr:hypothetical protein [Longimicrobium sp.]HEX6040298.1 hypothetical protein [Longimicrobium sp.]